MQKGLKFAKRSDIVIILALIVLSVVGIIAFNKLFADVPAMAEIYYKSELIMTVELKEQQEEKTFSLEQDNDVVIKLHSDGAISFLESDCPDKICINSGKL
ncbi:MAG TPA: NusG domain II-containing protein, partial [Oscillospiraceae bacterium]|nr:NusG domain II-containing protein [Oscillospiraceae bacterium]